MLEVYGRGGLHRPMSLLVWLATSDLRLLVYGMRPLYGTLRFLHLTGMAGFLGIIMLIEVNRLGIITTASLQSVRGLAMPLLNTAFAVTVLSGLALFLYDPIGVGLHTMFLPKLLLITVGLLHAYWIQRLPAMRKPRVKRASAAAALAVWVLVIGCSTWNAVERPLNPADVHRADPRG